MVTEQMRNGYELSVEDIRIRDPFVVRDSEQKCYYLFGTTDLNTWDGQGEGFLVYESRDLRHWSRPAYAFRRPERFWATKNFWAPEVHAYGGSWYMLASFKADGRCRGTQILRAERIQGPYLPISDGPVTPRDWECLDGTLFVDPDGAPWIVFSHEWLQIGDGAICCARLSPDLKELRGAPVTLFHASDAPWSTPTGGTAAGCEKTYVTDGPFVYWEKDGTLRMIWSSFREGRYCVGIAESETGTILGPWKQQNQPVLETGGHGMLFEDFSGKRFLAFHSPNTDGDERMKWVEF